MRAVVSRCGPIAVEPALQRTQGQVRVSVRRANDGRTRVADLFQEGCLKVRLPRPRCDREADLVMLNTAGGLTGGDRLAVQVFVGEGACAPVTDRKRVVAGKSVSVRLDLGGARIIKKK